MILSLHFEKSLFINVDLEVSIRSLNFSLKIGLKEDAIELIYT